ncbi:MAG: hypothetical protein HC799_02885 [Limnothrix sp. RL_2_0]|nr:hypothetical protein [Limnothrix sp. RL_2_0]
MTNPPQKLPWFDKLKSNLNSRMAVHVVLSASMILLTGILDHSLTQIALTKNAEWRGHITPEKVADTEDISILDATTTGDEVRARQLHRIKEIYTKMVIRRHVHSEVMALFYARYFATLYIISIAGLSSSLALLAISKNGWEKCSNYILNIFILSIGVVILYGNLMLSLDYQQNITNNENLALIYGSIIEEILSYLATEENKLGEALTMAEFIHYLDREIALVSDIALDFSDKKSLEEYERVQDSLDFAN